MVEKKYTMIKRLPKEKDIIFISQGLMAWVVPYSLYVREAVKGNISKRQGIYEYIIVEETDKSKW